jgi:hypothetical protein
MFHSLPPVLIPVCCLYFLFAWSQYSSSRRVIAPRNFKEFRGGKPIPRSPPSLASCDHSGTQSAPIRALIKIYVILRLIHVYIHHILLQPYRLNTLIALQESQLNTAQIPSRMQAIPRRQAPPHCATQRAAHLRKDPMPRRRPPVGLPSRVAWGVFS